ncbi:MAG: hypothetical protein HYU64_02200 [Armatimonadetes bacterium]|nr:hypothetical protein [Armatimonadota bacterium]
MTAGAVAPLNGLGLRNSNNGALSRFGSLKSESSPSSGTSSAGVAAGIRGAVDVLDAGFAVSMPPRVAGSDMLPVQSAAAWLGGLQLFAGAFEAIYGFAIVMFDESPSAAREAKFATISGLGDILAGTGLLIQAGRGWPVALPLTLAGVALSTLGTVGLTRRGKE